MFRQNLCLIILSIEMTAVLSMTIQQQFDGGNLYYSQKRSENKVDAETMAQLKMAYLAIFLHVKFKRKIYIQEMVCWAIGAGDGRTDDCVHKKVSTNAYNRKYAEQIEIKRRIKWSMCEGLRHQFTKKFPFQYQSKYKYFRPISNLNNDSTKWSNRGNKHV